MRIKRTIERIPGGLMVVPLILGALVNTVDQQHYAWAHDLLAWAGNDVKANPKHELLGIGGFTTAMLRGGGALAFIGLFLMCSAAQMNLRVGGRALLKGGALTSSKWVCGVAVGYGFALLCEQGLFGAGFDRHHGPLGLATLTIIAAMTNSNGGLYAALAGQYGNRSDVGAIAVLSLNDGPFLTMVALGLLGETFPLVAFLAALIPIGLGMLLGNLDQDIRDFLKPGERLLIPFFAFALGTTMNFANFLRADVVAGGVVLGVATVLLTGLTGLLSLAALGGVMRGLFGPARAAPYRSVVAGACEASVAGNATFTPIYIAGLAAAAPAYREIAQKSSIQISIAVITTAVLCPLLVMAVDAWQRRRGVLGTIEE